MTQLKELIAKCFDDHGEVEEAVARLAEHGHAAVVAILEYAEHTSVPAPAVLIQAIAAAAEDCTIDYLMEMLADSRTAMSHTAFRALGYIGDRRATSAIVKQLVSHDTGPFVCVPAATALTMLRDPAARAPLRGLLESWGWGRSRMIERLLVSAEKGSALDLEWPLLVVTALAALGDQDAAPLAYGIVALPKDRLAAVPDARELFSFFCAQLRHSAAPGLLAACHAALNGADHESKEVIAQVVAGIGTKDALAMLVSIAQDEQVSVSQSAAAWLERVADAHIPQTASDHCGEATRAWWSSASETFEHGVVYWNGEPWTPAVLFDALANEALEPDENLLIVTGIHLGQEMRRRGLRRAEIVRTTRAEAMLTMKAGGLYRYGYRFDPRQM